MKLMTQTPTIKSHHYECCMCGDHGLSHLLFRCSVCHFRSQHRYCSNLYPKADTYRVCNWCLIQQHNVDDHHNLNSISSSPQDQAKATAKTTNCNNNNNKKLKLIINHQNGGPSPKWLQPTSPIKKPIKSPPESRSPSGRKRITAQAQAQQEEIIRSSSILRRTKSSEAITSSKNNKMKKNNDNNNNKKWEINKKNESRGEEGTSGDWDGPTQDREMGVGVIKHVYRNKVRRYKLLDEVSS